MKPSQSLSYALVLATAALLLVGGAGSAFAASEGNGNGNNSSNKKHGKPAPLAMSKSGNAFFAFGPPALTGIAAAALTAPNDTVTGAIVNKVDAILSAKYDPKTVAAWRRLVTGQAAINAAGPALSGDIKCFMGPAGTVVGLRYGSAQVCETSANVVDVKIGTGFVSNVKVILSTPNATIGGLEFVVTEGKKSTSTFCGRALGLSAWIGKPGQAVGAIGGTCTAPVGASRRLRRRRGRSILGAAEEVEAAGDAPSATSTAPAAAPPATSTAPAAAPASNTAPAGPLLLPPLPPPPHHNHHERQQEQQQQPPPLRKHHHLREDNKEGAAAVPAPAAVTDLAPPQAALPSISRRRLAQAPNNGTTTGGLSASTLQVVLVPAPQGENNSGAYGNGTIFGG